MTDNDTQREQIREHLETRGSITPIDALNAYGCYRLGARIHELRKEGVAIATDRHPKKKYAIYRLEGE